MNKSISNQLIQKIFSLFLIFSLCLTIGQAYFEFQNTKVSIKNKLEDLGKTFGPALADGLFTLDKNVIDAILKGIQGNTIVIGVELFNELGEKIKKLGVGGSYRKDDKGEGTTSGNFEKTIKLNYGDDNKYIGKVIVFSQNSIIFEQLKYGYLLLIINIFLQIIVLLIIVLFSVKKLLAKPLEDLTEEIREIDIENLNTISLDYKYNNEFGFFKDNFNKLIVKITEFRTKITEQNYELEENKTLLEDKVKERTMELSEINSQFVLAAHKAGMAEAAIGVLHNIGNALSNAVIVVENLDEFVEKGVLFQRIGQLNETIQENKEDLVEYILNNEKGKKIPPILVAMLPKIIKLQGLVHEDILKIKNVLELIKGIINHQRSNAKIADTVEHVDLFQLVNDTVLTFSPRFEKNNIKIQLKVEQNLLVYVSKNRVSQVFQNLVTNSIECLNDEKGVKEITIYNERKDDKIFIYFKDNGPGISSELKEQIFHFGFTTKDEGSGIGLYSSLNIMKDLDGDIELVEDNKENGCLFRVQFLASK